jgi:hypothetical protein
MDTRAVENALTSGQFLFTEHSRHQMARRQISEADVRQVLTSPEEILSVRAGRVVIHRELAGYLLRVFMDVDRNPFEIVTVYRTSKIEYYRSRP